MLLAIAIRAVKHTASLHEHYKDQGQYIPVTSCLIFSSFPDKTSHNFSCAVERRIVILMLQHV
jgi:hypothetical protein